MQSNPFVDLQEEFSSYHKINKQMEGSRHYIAPREIKLPPNASGKVCTFQYVPIVETVTAILSDPEFDLQMQAPTQEGLLYDIKDGSAWKENPFFVANPEALTGQLYSDAVELDNALGPTKGKHKALNVYFTLVDLHKPLRSNKENIFLVLSVVEKELKENKENYQHFFRPLVDDLKKLEAGVKIGDKTVKVGLICYAADNLEASSIGGFSMCFSSADVCRVCHLQYEDLPEVTGVPNKDLWTREEYDSAVANIQPGVRGKYGVNSACIFNELQAFHCVDQLPLDIMHDFMERVAAFDAMSILKVLISSGLFTYENYNSLINDVKLGSYEAGDRPLPVNAKHNKIQGKAMSVCLHLRLMPYFVWRILGGNVVDSDALDLLVILTRIQEYLLADQLSTEDIENFEELVVEYFHKRKICEEQYTTFIRPTPKYHFLGTGTFLKFSLYFLRIKLLNF